MDYMNTDNIIKKSFIILKEMLNDRNEDITKIENITEEELLSFYNNSSIFDIEVNDKLKIIYNMASKIKIQDIRKFINTDEENEKNDINKTIIFISKEKLTTNNFKSFNEYKNKVNLQFFYIKELLFNIYRHELVPKHDVISSNEEIKKIMDKYLMKNKFQFPLILHTDPVCKYLNIKSNSLVKITRPSPTSGEYILYRYVV
jgi:DNA-directed RNA polymerases I, II, and III subunit RPABC1|tara:strand:+ start:60 stop:665 length:606 start_codon:yes stop_codon:yes gene_type:complete